MESTRTAVSPASLVSLGFRRHAVLVALAALLGALLAAAYATTMSTSYTATSAVLIRPSPGNPLSPSVVTSNGMQLTVAMATEVGLVSTPAVQALAGKDLKRPVSADPSSLVAKVPPNTQVIRIAYTAPTQTAAEQGAAAYAKAFLASRAETSSRTQAQVLSGLKKQLAIADSNLQKVSRETSSQTDPRSYAAQQVQLYADRVASLNDSISAAEAVSQDPGTVVTAAVPPSSPNGIAAPIVVGVGALLGLLAGLVLATVREWRDDRVRGGTDSDVAGLPVLTVLPRDRRDAPALVEQRPGDDPLWEAYRRLRTSVVAASPPPRILSISAVGREESAGPVATNLALALSEVGYPVTLVSADPGRRDVEDLLQLSDRHGLSELRNPAMHAAALVQDAHGVGVLPGGQDAGGQRDISAGPAFRTMLRDLAADSGYVLLSAASTATADGDAATVSADAVVLVVTERTTTHAEVHSAQMRLERLGVPVAGVVFVARERGLRVPRTPFARRLPAVPAVAAAGGQHSSRSSSDESVSSKA